MSMPVIEASNVTREQSINDIIESVALEQAALSHILNAEGEKIQKAVADSTEPDMMLKVNRSVKSMVNAVARLEVILEEKLELFSECACPEQGASEAPPIP